MMKRFSLSIIFILFLIFQLYPESQVFSKSFQLQAGYDDVCEISVFPIPAQTQSYISGMPFNIEDVYVRSSNKNSGRLIAYWSLLTNVDFILKVKAEALHHESESSDSLSYDLTFEYRFEKLDSAGDYAGAKNFVHNVPEQGNTDYTEYEIWDGQYFPSSGFLGFLSGGVYFKFTDTASSKIEESSNLPAGNYIADVWMYVTAKE